MRLGEDDARGRINQAIATATNPVPAAMIRPFHSLEVWGGGKIDAASLAAGSLCIGRREASFPHATKSADSPRNRLGEFALQTPPRRTEASMQGLPMLAASRSARCIYPS